MKESNTVLLLFFLAFGLRIFHLFASPIISTDGTLYIKQAMLISTGNLGQIHEINFVNLYPFVINLFNYFLGDWELAGKIVSILFGSLSVILFYELAKMLMDKKIAFTSAIFFCVTPHVVEYSSDVLREPLLWFLVFSSLYLSMQTFFSRNWHGILLSVISSTLSIFTRAEGFLPIFLILSWGVYSAIEKRDQRKYYTILISLYGVSLLLVLFSCLYLIKVFTGVWDFGHTGLRIKELFLTRNVPSLVSELTGLLSSRPALESFLEIAYRYRYVLFLLEMFFKVIKSIGVVFSFFLIAGIFLNRYEIGKGKFFFLMWITMSFIISYIHILDRHYFSTRHGLIIGIPAFIWVAKGFYEICEILVKWMTNIRIFQGLIFGMEKLALLFVVLISIALSIQPYRTEKLEMKNAGILLKQNGFSGKKIATFKVYSRVLFYAGAIPVILDELADVSEIKQEMNKKEVHYILIETSSNVLKKDPWVHNGFIKIEIPGFQQLKNYSFELYEMRQ